MTLTFSFFNSHGSKNIYLLEYEIYKIIEIEKTQNLLNFNFEIEAVVVGVGKKCSLLNHSETPKLWTGQSNFGLLIGQDDTWPWNFGG